MSLFDSLDLDQVERELQDYGSNPSIEDVSGLLDRIMLVTKPEQRLTLLNAVHAVARGDLRRLTIEYRARTRTALKLPEDAGLEWLEFQNGTIAPTLANAVILIEAENWGLAALPRKTVLGPDAEKFSCVFSARDLPWAVELGRVLTREVSRAIRRHLALRHGVSFSPADIRAACHTLAGLNVMDSVI